MLKLDPNPACSDSQAEQQTKVNLQDIIINHTNPCGSVAYMDSSNVRPIWQATLADRLGSTAQTPRLLADEVARLESVNRNQRMADSRFAPAADRPKIVVLDGDLDSRRQTSAIFSELNFPIQSYASPNHLLTYEDLPSVGCIISEVQLPDLSGLTVQQMLLDKAPTVPLVFVTKHADVTTVVRAMKHGAVDLLEKPVTAVQLLESVSYALELRQQWIDHARCHELVQTRIADLSDRERQVLDLVVKGWASKQIAESLHLSVRTVEHHRRVMMNKMGAKNLVELIHMMHRLRLSVPRTLRKAAQMIRLD